ATLRSTSIRTVSVASSLHMLATAVAGGAGTMLFQPTVGLAQLIVDGGSVAGTNTLVTITNPVDFTVRNAVVYTTNSLLVVSNLILGSNGTFTAAPLQNSLTFTVQGDATISSAGQLRLNGVGWNAT